MTVASGRSGVANSPINFSESVVYKWIISRVAGRTVLGEIVVTIFFQNPSCRGSSSTACANGDVLQPPEPCPRATRLHAVLLDVFHGHSRDNDMSWSPKTPSIYARSIRHLDETRFLWWRQKQASAR